MDLLAGKSVPLPRIYADYLAYLLQHTRTYLRDALGKDPWDTLKDKAEIVLSHPNRWGESQQKFLETAAITADLISRGGARTRLHFVEEAEAAACFGMTFNTVLNGKLEVFFESTSCN